MMGMFIFLASEVMFFGGLFATYFYLLGSRAEWPPPGTQAVHWYPIPFINTFLLLSSGVTMHFASDAVQVGRRVRFLGLTLFTIILGALFEAGQAWEFAHAKISFSGPNQFASAFVLMTGFHGLHVMGGLILLLLVLGRGLRGHFTPEHHVFVAAATIYWHFVDVVWIFLFGILYLSITWNSAG
jgi:cytochrome c oxidase subunit 3